MRISCSCNVTVAGSNNQSVTTTLFLNGVAITNATAKSWMQSAGSSQNNTMTAMINMNPNDYIELFVANATANNNVTVTDCTIDATSLH